MYKLKGTIKTITPVQEFATGSKKATIVVSNNDGYEGAEKMYAFEYFCGAKKPERMDQMLKYNAVGDTVEVSFEVESREYNGKYYSDLSAFRLDKVGGSSGAGNSLPAIEGDDVPF